MQYISMRKWRTTPPSEIQEFPFIVTYKGIPTYKVLSINEEYTELEELPEKILEKNSEEVDKFELGDNRAKFSAGGQNG